MKITIRHKKTSKGDHLYLDYNTKKNRYEFLKMYLKTPEMNNGKKLKKEDLIFNEEVLRKAEKIKLKRIQEYHDGILREYGIEMKKKQGDDFMKYFDRIMDERKESSHNNYSNWRSAKKHLVNYIGDRSVTFKDITEEWVEGFKQHLLKSINHNGKTLARNSALSYFTKLRVVVKEAIEEKYFHTNPINRVKNIAAEETHRGFLTSDEVKKLAETECELPILKKAFLFGCLTGMRISDILTLKWGDIQHSQDTGYFIRFRQVKTKSEVLLFISQEAYDLLGRQREADVKVFLGLCYHAWNNLKLKQWFGSAGIYRKLTFHSSRHTFATLQLNAGTDITVVSNLLGHSCILSTQRYAKVVNKSKREAVNRITLS